MRKFINSFSNAIRGIGLLFNSQINARIELAVTLVVLIAGFLFGLSSTEWEIILLCIAMVLGFESINTAIEIFADKLHPEFDKEIGKVKDVAAAAVLTTAIVAAIIGFIIFVPRIISLLIF